MGGQFNNKNPGKRGISLNVRHPKGLEIAQAPGRDVGHRRGRLLAGRARQLGPGLRRAARRSSPTSSTSSSRAWAAQGTYGRFRTVGPIANSFAGPVGDVGTARAGDAGGVGLLVSRLDGRLQLRARDAHRALPSRRARAKASGSTPRSPRSGSSSTAPPSSTGRRTGASGRATATARRTSRRRRMASIPAPGTIAGSPSRASRKREWRALTKVAEHPEWAQGPAVREARRRGSRTRTRSTR